MIYADGKEDLGSGASTIVGPDGQVLAAKGGREEGYVVAQINLAAIEAAKQKFQRNTTPAWQLYKDLYNR